MAGIIKRPSEVGSEVYLEDEETQVFVKENLGFGLQSVMKNDDEYLRNVFYLKCAQLKKHMQFSPEQKQSDIFYLSSKENIDVIFECMKKDSEFLQHNFEKIDSANLNLYTNALVFVGNDNLYTSFLGEKPNNLGVAQSVGSSTLDDYIKDGMQKLHPQEYESLEQKKMLSKKETAEKSTKKVPSNAEKLAALSGRPLPSSTTSKQVEKKPKSTRILTNEQMIALKAEKEKDLKK